MSETKEDTFVESLLRSERRWELDLPLARVPNRRHSMYSDSLTFAYSGEPTYLGTSGWLIDHRERTMKVVNNSEKYGEEMYVETGSEISIDFPPGEEP